VGSIDGRSVMSRTVGMAFVALLPASVLFLASLLQFRKRRSLAFLLQLTGAVGLVTVVLAHLCEGLGLFPWMGWGGDRSIGHYLDLSAAVIGLALFPLGYLLSALRN
jgi:hypothetical protein